MAGLVDHDAVPDVGEFVALGVELDRLQRAALRRELAFDGKLDMRRIASALTRVCFRKHHSRTPGSSVRAPEASTVTSPCTRNGLSTSFQVSLPEMAAARDFLAVAAGLTNERAAQHQPAPTPAEPAGVPHWGGAAYLNRPLSVGHAELGCLAALNVRTR